MMDNITYMSDTVVRELVNSVGVYGLALAALAAVAAASALILKMASRR
jgi:hypothetical protein